MTILLFLLASCFDPEPPRARPTPRVTPTAVPGHLEVDTSEDTGGHRSDPGVSGGQCCLWHSRALPGLGCPADCRRCAYSASLVQAAAAREAEGGNPSTVSQSETVCPVSS